jgi:hypothetical protein
LIEAAAANSGAVLTHPIKLERQLCNYHSSFALEDITATSKDGNRISFILKDFSPGGLLESVRGVRPDFAYDPCREIFAYQRILSTSELGTAICHGALVDEDRQHYWLLLEKVQGDELYKCDFSAWCDAARWLARMHAQLPDAAMRHEHDARLLRYDRDFCNMWIDRAMRFSHHPDHAARWNIAPEKMERVAEVCREAVRHICDLPKVFIHGEFYASNILFFQDGERKRICPVDWETSALGTGLLDLAALIAGNWTEEQRETMVSTYVSGVASPQEVLGMRRSVTFTLRCCRLFLATKWLGWSMHWQPPAEHRHDWFAEAAQMARLVESEL